MELSGKQFLIVLALCSVSLFSPTNGLCVPRIASYDYASGITISLPTIMIPKTTLLKSVATLTDSAKDKVKDVTDSAKDNVKDVTDSAKVKDVTDSGKDKVKDVTDSVKVKDVTDSAKDKVKDVTDSANDRVKDAAQGVSDIFQTTTTYPLFINPKLKDICSKTDYADICQASLSPLLSGRTDLTSVLQLAIRAAEDATKWALAEAQKMASAPGIDAATVSRLDDCKDSYIDALENFQSAIEAIPSMDIGTINSMLSAVITDYGTCDDGFAEFDQEPLMATYNEKLSKMGSNCLAIASLVN